MAGRQRFLGNRQVVGGRQRYTGQAPTEDQPKQQEHHGSGLLGRFASDIYNTAVHSPSGLYHTGKALVEAPYYDITKGPSSKEARKARGQVNAVATETVKAYGEDIKHPLRHPGNTFLDALALASAGAGTAARVSEAGRAARAGEGAAAVGRGLVKGPKPKARTITYNGEKVQAGQYSRSALRRGSQKLVDKFQQRFPDVKLGTRNLHERVGHELQQNRRITESLAKAPAAALAKTKLPKAQQKALQVVAEGVPVKERIAFHEKQLESFRPGQTKLIAATKKEIALLRSSEKHIHEVDGIPKINPANHKLIETYQSAHAVATKRENLLQGADRLIRGEDKKVYRVQALKSDTAQGRLVAPAQTIRSERIRSEMGLQDVRSSEKVHAEIRKLEGLLQAKNADEAAKARVAPYAEGGVKTKLQRLYAEHALAKKVENVVAGAHGFNPDNVPELFRYPYKAEQAKAAIFKPQGFKGGIPKTPGSVSHQFEGSLLKSGAFRNDTTKLVAESYLEAHRFAAVMKHRDQFLKLAHDARQSENDIPIRTDALLNKSWPKVIQDISEKPQLSKTEINALNQHYEDLRSELFPDIAKVERELAAGEHPNVKWIDKRVLGGLNEPNPAVAGSTRRFVNVFDHINNASRAAILYLKPAYAVPNILGNAALNIVQQGWAAPAQVGRSARLFWKLDKETRQKVKLAMGEGISGSLESERGVGTRAINAMAHLWQKPVDTPFRMNAFFYEARRAGYKTPTQIKALFNDEEKLLPIAREANAAIIDYGNLSPFEQSVIRRVIFFYPWVKGSTRYAGRFLTTHPTQAAFIGQEGKIGARRDQQDLGSLPSYAEGLFKVGERGKNPLTVNPTSAGILQTPAELGKTVAEMTSGHPGEAFTFSQNFTPALAAILAAVGASQRRRGQSQVDAAKEQLVGGLPILQLIQSLEHPPANSKKPRLYPRTERDAILHFLLGGLAPTPLNRRKAEQAKYLEDHPR